MTIAANTKTVIDRAKTIKKTHTWNETTDMLNNEGLKTPTGKKWTTNNLIAAVNYTKSKRKYVKKKTGVVSEVKDESNLNRDLIHFLATRHYLSTPRALLIYATISKVFQ